MVANVCMWMNDVAAAWVMTSLTTSPTLVALVQSASTLPVLLLGLPTGALADIVDRRRYLLFTQVWVAGVALLLALAILTDTLSAPLLLFLTFANGIGLAMRWPVYAALVPELVPRRDLSAALALNGVGMNVSRIVGPVIAGALIANAGSEYVFVLNAALSVVTATIVLRWKREPQKVSAMPSERMLGAIRVGLQHVRQSPHILAVMLRVFVFFLQSSALMALLPLVARRFRDGNASTYTLLLASMGLGAVVTALMLPRIRSTMTRDGLVRNGSLLHAAATLVMAFAPNLWMAIPAMLAAGAAWISVANSLTVAAQMGLPDWVRARGMSIVQMSIMAGTALGAALWGQVASLTSLHASLAISSACAVLASGPHAQPQGRRTRRGGPDARARLDDARTRDSGRARAGTGARHRRVPDRPAAPRRVRGGHAREPARLAVERAARLGAVPRRDRSGSLHRALHRRVMGRVRAAQRARDAPRTSRCASRSTRSTCSRTPPIVRRFVAEAVSRVLSDSSAERADRDAAPFRSGRHASAGCSGAIGCRGASLVMMPPSFISALHASSPHWRFS